MCGQNVCFELLKPDKLSFYYVIGRFKLNICDDDGLLDPHCKVENI